MKEYFSHSYTVIVVLLFALLASGCQTSRTDSVNLLLQSDNPTMVSFPLMAASQIYDFSADAQLPMQISIVPITRDLTYTAELRDDHGSVLATVASTSIQNAVLTVNPGAQRYQVAIKSDNTTSQGILSVQVSRTNFAPNPTAIKTTPQTPIVVPYQAVALNTTALTSNNTYVPCSVSSSTGVSVNLRSGPGTEYSIVGALDYGTALSVTGTSTNGWHQVIADGQYAWVSGTVTTVVGTCDNLPDVTPASANTTTNGIINLAIADTGWGSVYEKIASSDVNFGDLIIVTAPTLTTTRRYEEFTITLLCSGTGTDYLRWGAVEKPSLKCGGSIVLPLTTAYNQQQIAVTLLQSTVPVEVQYTLMASRHT